MNIRPLLPAAAIALLSLAACDNKPEVVDSRAPDPLEEQLKNAPKVELPPAIKASVSMRCQPGNALVFAEFFEGDKLVKVRTERDGDPTDLKAAEAGQPFTAEGGYKLTGNSKTATVELPGKGKLTCHA
ncbi:hypothetical protein M9978_12195 [Sphingomonas sp. MG17]|jgi:hypothetical protein|uniref:Uncharacterized protein n=1 Tax=Sphingomonas tagetis TaxID=2949092 RepID=A0A9X2HSP2_9SPHN|nr:hypothetical protein [Sphingomonas tagetis]MCP3731190.1 hypothetical protein [Sphingomonas tagetis]